MSVGGGGPALSLPLRSDDDRWGTDAVSLITTGTPSNDRRDPRGEAGDESGAGGCWDDAAAAGGRGHH